MWGGMSLSQKQAHKLRNCLHLELTGAQLDIRSEYDFYRSIVPKMKFLLTVDLSHTHLSDVHAPLLYELMQPQRGVLALNISYNDLGPKSLDIISSTIRKHTTLQMLDCSGNFNLIKNKIHAQNFGKAVGACVTITTLGVSFPNQALGSNYDTNQAQQQAEANLYVK